MEQSKTKIERAIAKGYSATCTVVNGKLYLTAAPGKGYFFGDINKKICPCTVREHTVYCFETPDGHKCHNIIDWKTFRVISEFLKPIKNEKQL